MLPSAGLLISKPQENKSKIIKFNWRYFLCFSKGNLNWEKITIY